MPTTPATDPAPQAPTYLTYDEWASSNPGDPADQIRGFRRYANAEMLRRGEWDEESAAILDEGLAEVGMASGLESLDVTPDDPDAAALSYRQDAVGQAAREYNALKSPKIRDTYDDKAIYDEKLATARTNLDLLAAPDVRNSARKDAVARGDIPFTTLRDSDGGERLHVADGIEKLDDKGIAALFEANPSLDPSLIGAVKRAASVPAGFTAPTYKLNRQREFMSAVAAATNSDPTVLAAISNAAEVMKDQGAVPQTVIEKLDRDLANAGLHGEFANPDDRKAWLSDMVKMTVRPDVNDDPAQNVIRLSTGEVRIPDSTLFNQAAFDAALASGAVPEEQVAALRANRENYMTMMAPETFKVIAANKPGFLGYREAEKAKGKTDGQILGEWMSDKNNYSAFRAYAGGIGESVVEGVSSLVLAPMALAGNDVAASLLQQFQRDTMNRKAYAALFGKSLGVGYDVATLVAPVAADLAVSYASGGAAVGLVMGKAGLRASVKGALNAALTSTTKTVLRDFAEKGALRQMAREVGVENVKAFTKSAAARETVRSINAETVINLAGRDLARSFGATGTSLGVFGTTFSRSAGSQYASLTSALEQQGKTPDEARKIALPHALAIGGLTAATTLAFSAAGRGGVEKLFAGDITARQANAVLTKVKNYVTKLTPAAGEQIDTTSLGKALGSMVRPTWAKTVLKGASDETQEETLQSFMESIDTQLVTKGKVDLTAAVRDAMYGGLLGGLMGGGATGVTAGIEGFGKAADAAKELTAQKSALLAVSAKLSQANAPETANAVRRYAESLQIEQPAPAGEPVQPAGPSVDTPPPAAEGGTDGAVQPNEALVPVGEPPVATPPEGFDPERVKSLKVEREKVAESIAQVEAETGGTPGQVERRKRTLTRLRMRVDQLDSIIADAEAGRTRQAGTGDTFERRGGAATPVDVEVTMPLGQPKPTRVGIESPAVDVEAEVVNLPLGLPGPLALPAPQDETATVGRLSGLPAPLADPEELAAIEPQAPAEDYGSEATTIPSKELFAKQNMTSPGLPIRTLARSMEDDVAYSDRRKSPPSISEAMLKRAGEAYAKLAEAHGYEKARDFIHANAFPMAVTKKEYIAAREAISPSAAGPMGSARKAAISGRNHAQSVAVAVFEGNSIPKKILDSVEKDEFESHLKYLRSKQQPEPEPPTTPTPDATRDQVQEASGALTEQSVPPQESPTGEAPAGASLGQGEGGQVVPFTGSMVRPVPPSDNRWRVREEFPGESFPVEPRSIIIQPRNLDSAPIGNPIIMPLASNMAASTKAAEKVFNKLLASNPDMSRRETLITFTEADGFSFATLAANDNGGLTPGRTDELKLAREELSRRQAERDALTQPAEAPAPQLDLTTVLSTPEEIAVNNASQPQGELAVAEDDFTRQTIQDNLRVRGIDPTGLNDTDLAMLAQMGLAGPLPDTDPKYTPVDAALDAVNFDPKNIRRTVEKIAKSGKTTTLRAAAKVLLQFPEMLANVRVVKVQIPVVNGRTQFGVFLPNGTILINTVAAGPRGAVDTLVHELLHAATESSIKNPTPAQKKVLSRLDKLRTNLNKKAVKDGNEELAYGTSSLSEFVTHFWTSPSFQSAVEGSTKQGDKPWTQVFIDLIRDLLGLPPGDTTMNDMLLFTKDAAKTWRADGEARMQEGRVGAMDWESAITMMRSQGSGTKTWDDDTREDFSDRSGREAMSIFEAFLNRSGDAKVPWKRVPAARLKRIWLDFGKTGFVRDSKGMDSIAETMKTNIARLYMANAMSGHDTFGVEDIAEANGYDPEDFEGDEFQSFLESEDGAWFVSDYGLPYLLAIYKQIHKAETDEDKLFAVDRALNVVHQRGDLAAMFVEGGTATLVEVSNQGGDDTPNIRFQQGQVRPYGPNRADQLLAQPEAMRNVSRFVELTAGLGETPTQADIDAWKAANPEAYDELKRMRETVLKGAGWDTEAYHHGRFDERENGVPTTDGGMHFGSKQAATERAYGKEHDDFIREAVVEYDDDLGAWFWRSQGEDSYDFDEGGFPTEDAARSGLDLFAEQKQEMSSAELSDLGSMTQAFLDLGKTKQVEDAQDAWAPVVRTAKEEGYDSLTYRNMFEDKGSTSHVVFDPTQIKSTEPLSLAPDGRLITPDRWADAGSPDIRFQEGRVTTGEVGQAGEWVTEATEKFNAEVNNHTTGQWPADTNERIARLQTVAENYVRDRTSQLSRFGWQTRFGWRPGQMDPTVGARAYLGGQGQIVVEIGRTAAVHTANAKTEKEAVVSLLSIIDEELVHAAHLQAYKDLVGDSPNVEQATADEMVSRFGDIVNAVGLSPTDKAAAERVVNAAFNIYFEKPGAMSPAQKLAAFKGLDSHNKIKLLAETVRMIVQQRRNGIITEQTALSLFGQAKRLLDMLAQALHIAVNSFQTLGPFRKDVEMVEAILSSGSDIRFQQGPVTATPTAASILSSATAPLDRTDAEMTLEGLDDVTAAAVAQGLVDHAEALEAGIRFMYGGVKANTFESDALDTAQAMAAAGKTPEEIRAVTGWFPGQYDGKMRWEIPDDGAKLTDTPRVWNQYGEKTNSRQGYKLSDVLDHQALFEAYPALEDVQVSVRYGRGVQREGAFRAKDARADYGMSISANGKSKKEALSVLVHEVQHAIQKIEGFVKGGNPLVGARAVAESDPNVVAAKQAAIEAEAEYNQLHAAAVERIRGARGGDPVALENELADLEPEVQGAINKMTKAKVAASYVEPNVAAARVSEEDAFNAYRDIAGEIEARDVQARQKFTPEQRKAIAPYSSENIAKEKAIVLFQQGEVQERFSRITNGTPTRFDAATLLADPAKRADMVTFLNGAFESLAAKPRTLRNALMLDRIGRYHAAVKAGFPALATDESEVRFQQGEVTELFRAGQDPDSYEGRAPSFDWDEVDNYGYKWTAESVREHVGAKHEFIYPAMIDKYDLNPKLVEIEDAKEIRAKNENQIRADYPDEFFGEDPDDEETAVDWRGVRDRMAQESEDSWGYSKQEMSLPFGRGYPPIVVRRIGKNEFEVIDGNHRVDTWQDQDRIGVVPAWVVDDWLHAKATQGGDTGIRFQQGEVAGDFYSPLARAIEAKMPKSATVQQVLAIARDNAKAEEVKWSGIESALGMLAVDGKVSREDVLRYLSDEGAVRFEEVELSDPNQEGAVYDWAVSDGEQNKYFRSYQEAAEYADQQGINITEDTVFRATNRRRETTAPKFSQYTLPGGENYREVVLAMPVEYVPLDKEEKAREIKEATRRQSLGRVTFDEGEAQIREIKRRKVPVVSYTSSHFPDVPNYVAHMRTNERTDAQGRPGLFIEEIQSDRHQAGRKKGYSNDAPVLKPNFLIRQITAQDSRHNLPDSANVGDFALFDDGVAVWPIYDAKTQEEAARRFEQIAAESDQDAEYFQTPSGIAPAPFQTTWPLAMFKRALRDAVASGKSWIGWTTGETQNDRFDLSKQVDRIDYYVRDDGMYDIEVRKIGERDMLPIGAPVTTEKLPDVVGKDIANRIVGDVGDSIPEGWKRLSGLDLKVGGSGMKGFYDTMLPKEIGKYVKQWGGKVEKDSIVTGEKSEAADNLPATDPRKSYRMRDVETPIWRIDITPQMVATVQEQGQALFQYGQVQPQPDINNPAYQRSEYIHTYEGSMALKNTDKDRAEAQDKARNPGKKSLIKRIIDQVSKTDGLLRPHSEARKQRKRLKAAVMFDMSMALGRAPDVSALPPEVATHIEQSLGTTMPLFTQEQADEVNRTMEEKRKEFDDKTAGKRKRLTQDRDNAKARLETAFAKGTGRENLKAYSRALANLEKKHQAALDAVAPERDIFEARMLELQARLIAESRQRSAAQHRAVRDGSQEWLAKNHPEIAKWTADTRLAIDGLQDAVMTLEGIDPAISAMVSASRGVYLVRRYAIHANPEFAEAMRKSTDPKWEAARNELIALYEKQFVEHEAENLKTRDRTKLPPGAPMSDAPMADWMAFAKEQITRRDLAMLEESGELANVTPEALRIHAESKLHDRAAAAFEDFIVGHATTAVGGGGTGGDGLRVPVERFLRKKDLPDEIRTALGEIKDPIYNSLNTMLALSQIIVDHRTSVNMAASGLDSGIFITEAQAKNNRKLYANWVPVVSANAESKAFPALAGLLTTPDYQKQFAVWLRGSRKAMTNDAVETMDMVTNGMMRAAGASLVINTQLSLGYYTRNVMGSGILAAMSGVATPGAIKEGAKASWRNYMQSLGGGTPETRQALLELVALGIFKDAAMVEQAKELTQLGMNDPINALNALPGVATEVAKTPGASAIAATGELMAKSTGLIQASAEFTETIAHPIVYFGNLEVEKAAMEEEFGPNYDLKEAKRRAAARTLRIMPTRTERSQGVEAFTRNPIGAVVAPFVGFKADMFRCTVNHVKQITEDYNSGNAALRGHAKAHAASFGAVVSASIAVPLIFRAIFGIGDDEDEALRAALPSYSKNSQFIPIISGDEVMLWDLTFANPMSLITDPITATIARPTDVANIWMRHMATDLIGENITSGALMDWNRNRDENTGLPIYFESDPLATKLQKGVWHVVSSAYQPPIIKKVTQSISAAQQNVGSDSFFYTPAGILIGHALPVRPRTFRLEDMAFRANSNNVKENRNEWLRTRELKSRAPVSVLVGLDTAVADLYQDRVDARRRVWEQEYRIAKGFMSLGMSKQDFRSSMVRAGFSRESSARLLNTGTVAKPTFSVEEMQVIEKADPGRADALRKVVARQPDLMDVTGR